MFLLIELERSDSERSLIYWVRHNLEDEDQYDMCDKSSILHKPIN